MEGVHVTLERHTAMQNTGFGPVEIEFNQYKVMVNGNLAGYVGKTPGQSVKMVAVNVPLQVKEEISRQVAELIGGDAIPVVQAMQIPDETNDEEDAPGIFDEEF